MIRIRNLQKTFNQGKANPVEALKNIDLTIGQGEFLVIVGANGSGKTTLLNCISGSILPTKGQIHFGEAEVTQLPEYRRSKWVARVFQNPLTGTASELSILDNFRLAALRTRRKGLTLGKTPEFVKKVQDQVATLNMGLEDKLNQAVGTLSGGQRQALTLMMSVMDGLQIILLDEPAAALDPRSAGLVMETANRLIAANQLTALLVTHNLKDAFTYGSRIIQMEEGSIIKDIGPGQKAALQQPELYEWFV